MSNYDLEPVDSKFAFGGVNVQRVRGTGVGVLEVGDLESSTLERNCRSFCQELRELGLSKLAVNISQGRALPSGATVAMIDAYLPGGYRDGNRCYVGVSENERFASDLLVGRTAPTIDDAIRKLT
jgi:hypothetical protein